MTTLIQELMQLSENKAEKAHTYFLSIEANYAHNDPDGKGRLHQGLKEDVSFEAITSLEQLADEISDDGSSDSKQFGALSELHEYLQNYHIGQGRSEVFDVTDEDYDVQSFKNDVLKVTYKFTVRYKKETKEPVTHRGLLTFMDA